MAKSIKKKPVTKEMIEGLIDDLCMDLFVYDRKNDEDIGIGDIEKAVHDGVIDIPQIVDRFRRHVTNTVFRQDEPD